MLRDPKTARSDPQRRHATLITLIMFLVTFASLPACQVTDYVGGRRIIVEFNSADGSRSGDAVYLSGAKIGKTGSSRVIAGKVHIPVRLTRHNRDALSFHTVFLLTDDPATPGRRCLVGYAVDSGHTAPAVSDGVFPGATNQAELAILLGVDSAKTLWDRLRQWIGSLKR